MYYNKMNQNLHAAILRLPTQQNIFISNSTLSMLSADRPGVWPGGLPGGVPRGPRWVLIGAVAVLVVGGGGGRGGGGRRFVRFRFILKPQRRAVEASAQAAALRVRCRWCSDRCGWRYGHEYVPFICYIHGQILQLCSFFQVTLGLGK